MSPFDVRHPAWARAQIGGNHEGAIYGFGPLNAAQRSRGKDLMSFDSTKNTLE